MTNKELLVLRELAIGRTYSQVSENLRMSLPSVHVHCQHIREKTGIPTTLQPRASALCAEWLDKYPELKSRSKLPIVPSPRQMQIMQMVAQSKTTQQIAADLGIAHGTVNAQLSAARARAGIVSRPGVDRAKQMRDYLATAVTMADPMFQ